MPFDPDGYLEYREFLGLMAILYKGDTSDKLELIFQECSAACSCCICLHLHPPGLSGRVSRSTKRS